MQNSLYKEYRKQVRRLQQIARRATKSGYIFISSPLPKKVKNPTVKTIERLAGITPEQLRTKGYKVDERTGELKRQTLNVQRSEKLKKKRQKERDRITKANYDYMMKRKLKKLDEQYGTGKKNEDNQKLYTSPYTGNDVTLEYLKKELIQNEKQEEIESFKKELEYNRGKTAADFLINALEDEMEALDIEYGQGAGLDEMYNRLTNIPDTIKDRLDRFRDYRPNGEDISGYYLLNLIRGGNLAPSEQRLFSSLSKADPNGRLLPYYDDFIEEDDYE